MRLPVGWLAAATALVAPAIAVAQQRDPYYGPHMWWGSGWHGWFMGPIMMIAVIALVVVLVVLLVRWLGGHERAGRNDRPATNTPLNILKERFARGEIDKEEFEERRRLLDD